MVGNMCVCVYISLFNVTYRDINKKHSYKTKNRESRIHK